jgi:hypothetical protein
MTIANHHQCRSILEWLRDGDNRALSEVMDIDTSVWADNIRWLRQQGYINQFGVITTKGIRALREGWVHG